MNSNKYVELKIVRNLYSLEKKISSSTLKIGDRFIYHGHRSLIFKTNYKPGDGKYLCCDEVGILEWLDGNIKVIKINRVVRALEQCSEEIKTEYIRQEKNK